MVPAASRRVPRAPRYSGFRYAPGGFAHGAITRCGRAFQPVTLASQAATTRPYNPAGASPRQRFGLLPVRSPLLGESLLFSLPPGTKMFQFPGFAPRHIGAVPPRQGGGLPHSDTCGSTAGCASPQLFAASRVLRRLLEPRHPPCALVHFHAPHTWGGGAGRLRGAALHTGRLASSRSVAVLCASVSKIVSPEDGRKWRISDSNRWPLACHASALAS